MNYQPALVPELDVANLERSCRFYMHGIGFTELFSRTEEAFCYLHLGDAHLMLEQADCPGRRFRTAPLEPPYGRGINLQIAHPDLEAAADRLRSVDATFVVPIETRRYRPGDSQVQVTQFVVADPDGYLIRLPCLQP